jgi:hypothetical protein
MNIRELTGYVSLVGVCLCALVAGCSKNEPNTTSEHTHAFDVAAVCQDIHVKQQFEYKGRLIVSTVKSKHRSAPFRLTSGFLLRDIPSTEIGREAVEQAQNPRLYRPPFSVKMWVENDEIINATPPFLMSGKTGGENEAEGIVDCNVVILSDAPLPR